MSTTNARPAFLADCPIVDADVHIHEDPRDLALFADGTLRLALEASRVPERWLDTPGLSPLTAYDPPLGEDAGREIHVVRDAARLRADLDQLGVDAAIVFTGRLLGTAARQDSTYSVGIARVFNRYLRERWLSPGKGIYGAIMVASQDPKASAREIEQCADVEGVAAVYLPMASVYPLWGHRQYDPIYAAAQAAGLPVVLQGYTQVHPVFPYQIEQFDTALAKQTISKPFGAIANLVSIVTTGVLARFPDLKVVFTECGVSWLPFVMWRLDQQYPWLRHEVPLYREKPSAYIRRQVYFTTHRLEEPDDARTLVALLAGIDGQDRALFATDWPHYDADHVERILHLPIPDEWKRQILGENARHVFKLPGLARRESAVAMGTQDERSAPHGSPMEERDRCRLVRATLVGRRQAGAREKGE
ncbi:MAG: amidohydrolase [Chloroflexi bacterium]|nr:amidohydrolase [Chloroflexota bacterium]